MQPWLPLHLLQTLTRCFRSNQLLLSRFLLREHSAKFFVHRLPGKWVLENLSKLLRRLEDQDLPGGASRAWSTRSSPRSTKSILPSVSTVVLPLYAQLGHVLNSRCDDLPLRGCGDARGGRFARFLLQMLAEGDGVFNKLALKLLKGSRRDALARWSAACVALLNPLLSDPARSVKQPRATIEQVPGGGRLVDCLGRSGDSGRRRGKLR